MWSPHRHFPTLALALVTLMAASALAQTTGAPANTLYKRLGGYDAIAAVVDDFIPKLATDPQLGKYFVGVSKDSQGRIRQLVVDQVCAATGGPCIYLGRSMKAAHAGLGITEAEWQIAVKHLTASLDTFKVPAREKDDLLGAVTGLKPDIVEKP